MRIDIVEEGQSRDRLARRAAAPGSIDGQAPQDRMVHPVHTNNRRGTTSYQCSLRGRILLLRCETWQDYDEPRAQPEGLHDTDDNEGIGSDAVCKHRHHTEQQSMGQSLAKWILF